MRACVLAPMSREDGEPLVMAPGRMHSNHLLSVDSKKMLFLVRSWNEQI